MLLKSAWNSLNLRKMTFDFSLLTYNYDLTTDTPAIFRFF